MNLEERVPNRLKGFALAILISLSSSIFLRYRGLSPVLKLRTFTGGGEIFKGTALLPKEGFYVADIGAYRGWYCFLAAKIAGPAGHVYCFEPEPGNFQVLKTALRFGGFRNVTLFRLALSDRDGFEELFLSEHPTMHSIVLKRGVRRITVPSRKLDTLIRHGYIDRLDLVKVDVEGASLKVLRGCVDAIKRFQPIFSIDVNHYSGEFEEVRAFLERNDYKILPLHGEIYRPYSIVACAYNKEDLCEQLIFNTRKLSSTLLDRA